MFASEGQARPHSLTHSLTHSLGKLSRNFSKLAFVKRSFLLIPFLLLFFFLFSPKSAHAAILNFTGWESGDSTEVVQSSGTSSVQNTTVRTGGYALRVNPTTTGTGFHGLNTHDSTGAFNNHALNDGYFTFYFRFATAPSSNDEPIFALTNLTSLKLEVRLNSAGKIAVYDKDALLVATGTTVLSTNTWYRIGVRGGNGISANYEVQINGVSELSGTANQLENTITRIRLGKAVNRNGNTVDFFYDDYYSDDTSFPAAGQVFRMDADGNGTYTAWTGTYTDVDDVPHDGDTTYITSSTNTQAETVTLESGANAGLVGTPKSVKPLEILRDEGSSFDETQLRLRSGSIDTDAATAFSLSTTYEVRATIHNTDPADGLAWTVADLDGLEVGVEENANIAVRVTALYVMVLEDGVPTNQNPNAPSSLGPAGLVDGSFTADNTPTPTFTLSDPDAGDTVKFRIQIDDTSDFSSPVVDYTSALAAQGATSFTVGQAVGSGTYTTGSAGQTLSDGSYYWRVKAIDDDAAESAYSTANSGAIAFKVDATAPSISSPTSSDSSDYIYTSGTSIYYGDDMPSAQSFTVSGSASDAGSGLNQATFTSTCLGSPGADATPASWSGTYSDVASDDTCTTTITVTVSDAAGNTSTQDYTVARDTTNPTVDTGPTLSESSAYLYASGTTIYYGDDMPSAQSFSVSGTASDASAGLWKSTFTSSCLGTPADDTSAASWSGTYSDADSADTCTGAHTITLYDNVSNTATTTITATRDTINPTAGTLSVSESSSYLSTSGSNFYYSAQMGAVDQTATFTVDSPSDGGSGLQKVTFPAFFGSSATDDTTSPYSLDFAINNADTDTGSFNVTTYDNVGNSATTNTITVVKDTTGPTISSPTSSDSSDYIYTNGTIIYYGDDMSVAQSFTISGSSSDSEAGLNQATFTSTCLGSPGADATPASWSATYSDVASDDTCTTTITVTVSDNVGNTGTQDYTVNRDTTNPSTVSNLTSSSHTTSTWSTDTTIDVSWTASTDTGGSGVAGYSYLFDTSATTTPDTTSDGTGTSTTSSAQSDGNSIYFHARAVDNVGNWGSGSNLGPFYVDTTAPSVPGTPSTTSPTSDNTPTWTWTASTDASSGLHATTPYSVQWCTDSGFTGCAANTATSTTNSYTHSVSLSDNTWYFRAKAMDAVSNESGYSSNGSVVVDTTAPSVSVTALSPDPTTDTTPTLAGTATDTATALTAIQFQVDSTSGSWSTCTADDGTIDETAETFACTTSALSDGSHTIYIRATDSASNTTALANYGTDTFTVDTGAPSVALTAISPDPGTDTTPTVSGTATDTTGTVSTVQFQVDSTSGSWGSCTADDGTFDEASETFTCTTAALSDGSHTIYVRSTDNSSNTSSNASDSFTVDTTAPAGIDLDGPGDNSYTNSERPTFKWKATTDATAGLSKYVLEIDNPSIGTSEPSGDFTIDSIPTSRTTDYETNKYIIRYENFSDSDSTNNYISVETKSHKDWGTSENDGKLKEGRVSWKVKAVDNAGNETSATRTLFVDRTSPKVEFTQINEIPFSTSSNNKFSTTDKTTTIFGKITDNLSGGDSSQAQDENGPKIASGPKKVEIKVEKKEGLFYKLHTLYTINMDKPWYSCDNKEVPDNSKQKCDKYLPFEYTSKEDLTLGTYKITLSGKDKADNASSTSFTLNITTLAQITTPEEKKAIEEELKELPKEEQERIKEELEITKQEEPPKPGTIGKLQEDTVNFAKNIFKAIGSGISSVISGIGNGIAFTFSSLGKGLAFGTDKVGDGLAFVGNQIGHGFKAIGNGYNNLANNAPGVAKTVLTGIGNGASTAGNAVGNAANAIADSAADGINNTKEGIADIAFGIGEKTDDVSHGLGTAIIKIGYLFVPEPTRITNVRVAKSTPNSMTITWETNHPANGKVNYGLTADYGQDVQTDKRVTNHEFTVTGLAPNTTYYYEVMSQNKNYVYDANHTFTTPKEK